MPPSKFNAILGGRCPRCRKGKMFSNGIYSSKTLEMNETCHHCGFRYEIQPGFFWGASYINYAFVVAIFAVETTALYLLGAMDTIWLYILSPATCIILLPVIFRAGRILFLHIFGGIPFEEEKFESEKIEA